MPLGQFDLTKTVLINMYWEHHESISSTNDRGKSIAQKWLDSKVCDDSNGSEGVVGAPMFFNQSNDKKQVDNSLDLKGSLDSLTLDPLSSQLNKRPILISATTQTKGRGRLGRQWRSTEGGAWFTVVFPWRGALEAASVAPLATGWAVYQAILEYLRAKFDFDAVGQTSIVDALALKWPNDLLLDHGCQAHKVAGILCEQVFDVNLMNRLSQDEASNADASNRAALVVGVGINVNQSMGELDEHFRIPAISLKEAFGSLCIDQDQVDSLFDVADLIQLCAQKIVHQLTRLQQNHDAGQTGLADEDCQAMNESLAWRGQSVTLHHVIDGDLKPELEFDTVDTTGKKTQPLSTSMQSENRPSQNVYTCQGDLVGLASDGGIVIRSKQGSHTFYAGELRRGRACE